MNTILSGNIYYSKSPQELSVTEGGYLVCENGLSKGVYTQIPEQYKSFPVVDYKNGIIIPGLCDLHTHAPQFAYRGLGMSLELLDWLNTYTFPEESKYTDLEYAEKAYSDFVRTLSNSATTRACIFATVHLPATALLMEKLEASGIVSYTGLVNMDRNSAPTLQSKSAQDSISTTKEWIELTKDKFKNTKPMLTPRFIPTCSDELMRGLKTLQQEYYLPLQSHLSENLGEIEWVRELCPDSGTYAGAYNQFGLFGGEVPTVMAHCVWCSDEEREMLRSNGVFVAHCPQSNANLSSGIAPIRDYMNRKINIGLASDVSGGASLSIFCAMSDAVQESKLYWRHVDDNARPLSFTEAFYLATLGGGSFFGKAGSFEDGYEFDAVVLDDSKLATVYPLTAEERLERLAYLGGDSCVTDKYIRGIRYEQDK